MVKPGAGRPCTSGMFSLRRTRTDGGEAAGASCRHRQRSCRYPRLCAAIASTRQSERGLCPSSRGRGVFRETGPSSVITPLRSQNLSARSGRPLTRRARAQYCSLGQLPGCRWAAGAHLLRPVWPPCHPGRNADTVSRRSESVPWVIRHSGFCSMKPRALRQTH